VFKLPSLAGALLSDSTTDLSADQCSASLTSRPAGKRPHTPGPSRRSTPTIGGVSYVVASAGDIAQAFKDFSESCGGHFVLGCARRVVSAGDRLPRHRGFRHHRAIAV